MIKNLFECLPAVLKVLLLFSCHTFQIFRDGLLSVVIAIYHSLPPPPSLSDLYKCLFPCCISTSPPLYSVGSISGVHLWWFFSVRTKSPGAPLPYVLHPLPPRRGQPPPLLLLQPLPPDPGKPQPPSHGLGLLSLQYIWRKMFLEPVVGSSYT